MKSSLGGNWPAVVSTNTPHADAANGLSMKQSLSQWVNQVHGVVLQNHPHVFALLEKEMDDQEQKKILFCFF